MRDREINIEAAEREIREKQKSQGAASADLHRTQHEVTRHQQEVERLKNLEIALTQYIDTKKDTFID